jgi:indolepyruvate ferredoxin oxidoreductase beta subunit
MNLQILLCGVGGQGILFATKILSEAALKAGHQVIGSETHGMSQRGGSVTSHMKVGDYRGPLIRRGSADLIFCFEKSELLANLSFLKPGGIAFMDAPDLEFIPDNVRSLLQERDIALHCLDASSIALKLQAPLVLNLIVIGFAASHTDFPLDGDLIEQVIMESSPPRFSDLNLKAFHAGLNNKSVEAL